MPVTFFSNLTAPAGLYPNKAGIQTAFCFSMSKRTVLLSLVLVVSSFVCASWSSFSSSSSSSTSSSGYASRLICRIANIDVYIVQEMTSQGFKVRRGSARLDEGLGPVKSALHQFRTIAHPADRNSSGVSVFKFTAFEREFTLRVAQNAQFQLTNKNANSVAFGEEIPEPAICETSPISH